MFTSAKAQLKAENRSLMAKIAKLEEALKRALENNGEIKSVENSHPDAFGAITAGPSTIWPARKEAEDQFWMMFDRAVFGLAKMDTQENRICRVNAAFSNMTGYAEAEIEALSLLDLTHPDDRERTRKAYNQLLQGELDSCMIEKRYLKKNGDFFWAKTTVTVYPVADGEPRYTLELVENVSLSRAAEDALRESEERFELAVKGSNDGLWDWVDVEKEVMWMSPRLYELLGYGSDDTLPTISLFKSLLHPDDTDRVWNHIMAHLKERVPYDIEYRLFTGNNEYRWFRARGQAMWDERGNATRMSGSLTDISAQKSYEEDLKRYAEELRISKERAEAGTRAKTEFLANMSHEIRTPMNGILGYTELLLETPLNEDQQEYIEIVHNNGRRLLNLLDGILDISKIESGQMELVNGPFDLVHLLDNTFETLRPAATEKGLKLDYILDQGIPSSLIGDDTRLGQILVNLLSNAIKFTEQGNVELMVHPDTAAGNEIQLHFVVKDTGIGISKADKQQIFEKFTQLDNSATRRYNGSGLGLAISNRLVERMQGKMWVESEEGMGSSFHFRVKLGLPEQTPPLAVSAKSTALHGLRVLFAVDNALNEQRLNRQLKAWGMDVVPVRNATDAEDALERLEKIDLCIIDVEGDNAGGLSVARHIREHAGSALPLVLLSADGRHHYEPEIVSLSIVKPVAGSQLLKLLSGLLYEPGGGGKDLTQTPKNEQSAQSVHILLAEDEADNQKLAFHFLNKLGYKVTLAQNGREAVAAFEDGYFDIVLMDIQMPEMDGEHATTRIRAMFDERGDGAPGPWIIAVTARAMVGDRERFLEVGMDDYLSKPYSKDSLVSVLERAKAEILGPSPLNTSDFSEKTT